MLDANLLVFDWEDSSDGLGGFALEIAVRVRVEALRRFIYRSGTVRLVVALALIYN